MTRMETFPNLRKLRAWSIHIYTSFGLIAGLLALNAIVAKDAKTAFLWMGLALFIDATDGAMARRWQVKVWAPHFDGRKLDDITDYLNYAFIPAFLVYQFKLVEGVGGMVVLGLMLLTAAYGFCQSDAKTNDGYFTGWPNFWNLLVFYLYIFNQKPEINAIVLLICAALIFVPVKYVSFSTHAYYRVTRLMSLIYGVVLGLIVARIGEPDQLLISLSFFFPVYYVGLSLLLNIKTDWQTSHGTEIAETKPH